MTDRVCDRSSSTPACTHMGGTLTWNPAEETWDCPLHGSRFTAAGGLVQGPATADLREVPPITGSAGPRREASEGDPGAAR